MSKAAACFCLQIAQRISHSCLLSHRWPIGRRSPFNCPPGGRLRRLSATDLTLSTSSCSSLSNDSRASRYSLLSFGYRSSLMFLSSLKLVFECSLDGCSWPKAVVCTSTMGSYLAKATLPHNENKNSHSESFREQARSRQRALLHYQLHVPPKRCEGGSSLNLLSTTGGPSLQRLVRPYRVHVEIVRR